MAEFLPICDLLFNVISLAIYFCDQVFDLMMSFALYDRGLRPQFYACIAVIATSSLAVHYVSLRWLCKSEKYRKRAGREPTLGDRVQFAFVCLVHGLQFGVVWRYAKLMVPVRVRFVKYDVRDLCLLRMIHAFAQSLPMLLFEWYLLLKSGLNHGDDSLMGGDPQDLRDPQDPREPNFVKLMNISIGLSLVSICWSLASFSKNVRLAKVHKLILTWLGVIVQFCWRLCLVSARVIALVNYAAIYSYWIFVVLVLHWLLTFLWLQTPHNVFDGEQMPSRKKSALCALIAFVMIVDYVNLQEHDHREKMALFYSVMFVENLLLAIACTVGPAGTQTGWFVAKFVLTFVAGILFMLVYYSFLHIRRIKSANANGEDESACSGNGKGAKLYRHASHGVFSCRFTNPAFSNDSRKRKKKKPTTFIPPPNLAGVQNVPSFWQQPLPQIQAISAENEFAAAGSRVNIYQKLQEKKQKQLAELHAIEEEIKQGKLARDTCVTNNSYMLLPVPQQKRHNSTAVALAASISGSHESGFKAPPPPTAEIVLSPNRFYPKKSVRDPNTGSGNDDQEYFEIVSDLDSQLTTVSRSFTFPKPVKYHGKRNVAAAAAAAAAASQIIRPSTNSSSDGDVESDDTTGQNQSAAHSSYLPHPHSHHHHQSGRKKFRRLNATTRCLPKIMNKPKRETQL